MPKNASELMNKRHSRADQLFRPESLARLPALAPKFYDRDPRGVASELLGKILARGRGRTALAARIVEVEVYLGEGDLAAHAAFGLTPRNAVLFGTPGHAYVYFTYGMHYCLNVSCMPPGQAGSVLFRALEPLTGLAAMASNRGISPAAMRHPRVLASGPARLCQAFGITRLRDNGKDLTSKRSDLRIVDDGFVPEAIAVSKRIGITKSPELPLRYFSAGNEFVSK
jgi:DNA-3-methyladenine glycosylase